MELKFCEALLSCVEGIYVIEEETRRVYYANRFFDREGISPEGRFCYEAMAGRRERCDYCPHLKCDGNVYVWDFYDTQSKKWYKIKNCLVSIDGTLYRIGNVNAVGDMMDLGRDAIREVAAMQRLVDERDQMRKLLEYESSHDKLTGVLNRNQYIIDLQGELSHVECAGILFFDLNNLKEVNDNYFHSEGDRLLCRLADAIYAAIGADAKCYRLGGDEFVLIMPDCSKKDLELCRTKILKNLEQKNRTESIPCSVAVGSAWSTSGPNLQSLITEADRRMYENKKFMKKGKL